MIQLQESFHQSNFATAQSDILLCTINAKYIHSSFGLRYLYANMQDLQEMTEIIEFNIKQQAEDICEQILQKNPKIVGLGVYIWNTDLSYQVVSILKTLSPKTIIILGGPEVSYETEDQEIIKHADFTITGMADLAFYQICNTLLQHNKNPLAILPANKIIKAGNVSLAELNLPYQFYNQQDIAQRVLYVEASRGCPFKCEFCLSSLDKTAWPFDLDNFLAEMQDLYQRGARHFKFVDRTFNLKAKSSLKILTFFLDKIENDGANLFLHFELIPDNLPEVLKDILTKFPKNSIQFEIGIQTFTQDVQQRISRKQDNEKSKENIIWLLQNTQAHLHTDLIFGLPGETLESFANSFNQLVDLRPHEIQFGILKRLKGTPIIRHTEEFNLKFNHFSPFNIISNKDIDYLKMREMVRFSRYWDMIYNSGRFKHCIDDMLGDNPFQRFWYLSMYLYKLSQATHKISLQKLFAYIYQSLLETKLIEKQDFPLFEEKFLADFHQAGFHHSPSFIHQGVEKTNETKSIANKRQKQHS